MLYIVYNKTKSHYKSKPNKFMILDRHRSILEIKHSGCVGVSRFEHFQNIIVILSVEYNFFIFSWFFAYKMIKKSFILNISQIFLYLWFLNIVYNDYLIYLNMYKFHFIILFAKNMTYLAEYDVFRLDIWANAILFNNCSSVLNRTRDIQNTSGHLMSN